MNVCIVCVHVSVVCMCVWYVCMYMWCVYVYVCGTCVCVHMCMCESTHRCPLSLGGIRSQELVLHVIVRCPQGCLDLSSVPLKEQQANVTSEPPLQPARGVRVSLSTTSSWVLTQRWSLLSFCIVSQSPWGLPTLTPPPSPLHPHPSTPTPTTPGD